MRFAGVLLFVVQVLFSISVAAQSNDTIITIKDSTREEVRQTVKEEFERWQDSVQAERIRENVKKNGKSLDVFLKEMEEKEAARKRQLYVRIGLGAVFLIALVLAFARRRKKT